MSIPSIVWARVPCGKTIGRTGEILEGREGLYPIDLVSFLASATSLLFFPLQGEVGEEAL